MNDYERLKREVAAEKKQTHEESLRFRAWVPSINKMIYQEDFFHQKDGGMLGIQFDKDGVRAEYYTDNEIITEVVLMRHTGIKDRKLNGLYQGDIVRIDDTMLGDITAQIVWGDGGWRFENNDISNYYFEYQFGILSLSRMGNIYEDKDLLQKIY